MVYREREGLETERMGRLEGYAGDSCCEERGFGGGDFVDGGHVCFWGLPAMSFSDLSDPR